MLKRIIRERILVRVNWALVMGFVVAASLLGFPSLPVKALEVSFPSLPDNTLSSVYAFSTKLVIGNTELIPIQSVNLEIYNSASPNYKATANDLPLTNGSSKNYSSTDTGGGGSISVSATSPNNDWNYFSGAGYANWQGTRYSFGPTSGYGHAAGIAEITYSIKWTCPSAWPNGNYLAKITIVATSPSLSQDFVRSSSTFGLFRPSPVISTIITSGLTVVPPLQADQDGIILTTCLITTTDLNLSLYMTKGTKILDSQNKVPGTLSAASATKLSAPPPGRPIVSAYDLGPSGVTFSPSVPLAIAYEADSLPEGAKEAELYIAYWDNSAWVGLTSTVDTSAKRVIAQISHFTQFALISPIAALVSTPVIPPVVVSPAPAAFAISDLTISPTIAAIEEEVSISILIANTGELRGNYTAVLGVNSVALETKNVTVEGGARQTVLFTTNQDAAGTYSVTINTLSGTFTVTGSTLEVPDKPMPTPKPTTTPLAPPQTRADMINWELAGGITIVVMFLCLVLYFLFGRRAGRHHTPPAP